MGLYLAGVDYESITDAIGVSCVLFFSGCKRRCNGCHSSRTHDFNYGEIVTDELIESINKEIDKRPFLNALVISGGDPMYSAEKILKILPKLHIPNNNLWIYSGFTFEQIQKDKYMSELLSICKVLVDGKFEIENRDITLQFRGSLNQRVIDVQKSLSSNKVVLWNEST